MSKTKPFVLHTGNIESVMRQARKQLEKHNVPKEKRYATLSIYGVWLLHKDGLDKYLSEARILNKRFYRFKHKKLYDKRTKGSIFLNQKYQEFRELIKEKKIKVDTKHLTILW